MHTSSYNSMADFLIKFDHNKYIKVLDVGSFQYEGHLSYKNLCSKKWEYIGLDLKHGLNVDVVPEDPYRYPFSDNTFDLIISGQCFEHVDKPWILIQELYRILKPGGVIYIIAPSKGPIHTEHDCWRILPDGMASLLDWGGFRNVWVLRDTSGKWGDCIGCGEKI